MHCCMPDNCACDSAVVRNVVDFGNSKALNSNASTSRLRLKAYYDLTAMFIAFVAGVGVLPRWLCCMLATSHVHSYAKMRLSLVK